MKTILAVLLLVFTAQFSLAETYSFEFPDYKTAKKSSDYIRFDMKSTKVGIITISFEGFVKKFAVHGEKSADAYKNIFVQFPVDSMDTNIDSRNEKMWNEIFDRKNAPEIIVTIQDSIPLGAENFSADAIMTVRGQKKPLKLVLTVKESDGIITVDGRAAVSIKQLELPDPSIAIARVHDPVHLYFHFNLK